MIICSIFINLFSIKADQFVRGIKDQQCFTVYWCSAGLSLAHPYTNHYADIPADDALGRARSRVMDLIFYSLPDKHLFRLLYDISRGQTAVAQERLDKDYAESYIGIVDGWGKRGYSPTASPFGA